ncbi:unnamed protein product [Paramecium sonneborni]|uniref:Uncharacterized protein n=1 Tax=Paramecium sonneborni TaxID=65129 RepID=A0A8S1RCL6_9CILI|nr:unnamed protein product [Paramecium sonneborni]
MKMFLNRFKVELILKNIQLCFYGQEVFWSQIVEDNNMIVVHNYSKQVQNVTTMMLAQFESFLMMPFIEMKYIKYSRSLLLYFQSIIFSQRFLKEFLKIFYKISYFKLFELADKIFYLVLFFFKV